MIFFLSTLINLCLVVAVWLLSRRKRSVEVRFPIIKKDTKLRGLLEKAIRKAAISEKLSERAFSLASSANIACMALQKTLQVRPYASKQQRLANEIAQKTVLDTVGGAQEQPGQDYSQFEWLYPILSDEEREIVDKAVELNAKYKEGLPNKT